MTVDFSEEEIEQLVDILQYHEKCSRLGFAKSLARNVGRVSLENLQEKIKRAEQRFKLVESIRHKLGDDTRVKME